MDYAYEDGLCATFDELRDNNEGGSIRGSISRKRKNDDDDDTRGYKSKNLKTERKRREKLSSRLLMLRSLMTREAIIEDAITCIKNMQDQVESLTQELRAMEASSEKTEESKTDKIDAAEEMKKCGIQAEVKVTQIDGNKLWMKIIIEKKRGRIKKLIEAMNTFGIELIDTNITTTKGAFLITTCIQGMNGERLAGQQTQELMLDITRAI